MIVDYILSWALIHLSPFAAFALGVWISIRIIHTEIAPQTIWLMAIPVALITIGNFMQMTYIDVPIPDHAGFRERESTYTYMQNYGTFLVFAGTLVLYGTAVPQLFNRIRLRVVGSLQPSANGGDVHSSK